MATVILDTSYLPDEDSKISPYSNTTQSFTSVSLIEGTVEYSSTAQADRHIWFEANKNEKINIPSSAYLPASSLTHESLPRRIKCAACQMCIPEHARSHLTIRCKPTFRLYPQKLCESADKHHFIEKAVVDSSCHKCRKRLSKTRPAHVCSWCHYVFHQECQTPEVKSCPCSMGRHSKLILPPSWLVKIEKLPLASASSLPVSGTRQIRITSPIDTPATIPLFSPTSPCEEILRPTPGNFSVIPQVLGPGATSAQPLLVFVHPKSGGGQGLSILKEFMWLLNPRQVFDLTKVQPGYALELFSHADVRVLCCGGDGTAGWVMTAMEKLKLLRKPPISLLPLGTGNDLSRVSGWGSTYTDEPLSQILFQIESATVKELDRWDVDVSPLSSGTDPPSRDPVAVDNLPVSVMSNYFSIGADAHASLEFHHFRERNKDKPQSRFKNKFIYLKTGSIDFLKRTYLSMCEHIQLECDGRDYTPLIRENNYAALVVLNIPSYGAGTDPWGTPNIRKSLFKPQDHTDGILEVIGLKQSQISLLYVGGHGERIAQAKKIRIQSSQVIPAQVDGEPCLLNPSFITISWKCSARLLINSNPKRERQTMTDFTPSHSDVEPLRLSLNIISLHSFHDCNKEIAQLRETASCHGYVICNPSQALSSLRPQVEHNLQSHLLLEPPDLQPPSYWCFLSISPADRHIFMRVQPDQEDVVTVNDIPSDGVYILKLESGMSGISGTGSEGISLCSDIESEDFVRVQTTNGEPRLTNYSPSGSYKLDNNEATTSQAEPIIATSHKHSISSDLSEVSQEELEELLFKACSQGDLKRVKQLQLQEVNLYCLSRENRTPLHITASKGHRQIAQLLIDNYPQIALDIQDDLLRESALHIAASVGNRSICKMLVKAHASLKLLDSEGRTPYQRSKQGSDFSLQSYLWKHEQGQREQKLELNI